MEVAFYNLKNGQNGMEYAINISDVVFVNSAGPKVLTSEVPKKYSTVSYQLKKDDDQETTYKGHG